MPSYYDATKKCRVGTMDPDKFLRRMRQGQRRVFSQPWTAAGGSLKWGAGGVRLRCRIDGKEVGIGFVAPQFAGKKDRIELACASLAKQLGPGRLEKLESALRAAAGELVLGKSMLSIVQPGTLAAGKQKALTKAFLDLL